MDSTEPDPSVTAGLIERARTGDQAAYDELFSRVTDRTLLFIRMRLGSKLRSQVEPHDLLQEAYLQAHKHFQSFQYRGEGSFASWICQIIENQIRGQVDYFRALKRRPPGAPLPISRVLYLARASATGPATAIDRQDLSDQLTEALDLLPENERLSLLLRYFQDRTLDEIAETLQTSPTTARRILGRATRQIGSMIQVLRDQSHDSTA
ncbi:MAG: sigma-70 family RNA polymerase sigma factor [Planctomycetota bacterium]|jgi:RNA polymerase sigma-70 factor (ECF subfamily)|nr:sigma-70 family RNA polymerase sigma factor [Planctomycetota bacterium]